ncbi:hypothetical protein KKA85_10390 [bacterium]|nr:hypothetical protein [bacterium]
MLVQPINLHPDAVAGSSCVMDMPLWIPDLEQGSDVVAVCRRESGGVDPGMTVQFVAQSEAYVPVDAESWPPGEGPLTFPTP